MDAVNQKNSTSVLLDRIRPLMDSKLGPFVLTLTALIVLSWILQVVAFALGAYEQPSPMVELLSGPVYTTLLVAFTLIALLLAVDSIEHGKHARASEYASAYEEVANAYKDAAKSSEELKVQLRTEVANAYKEADKEAAKSTEALEVQLRAVLRVHALCKLFISITERERDADRVFKVAESALRGGDLARAQDAIDRLDSNRKTIDEYLHRYYPSHSTDAFTVTLDEREPHIEGEDECPSTSSKLKYKELKLIQPKWTQRYRKTMDELEREIEHNKDGM